MGRSLSSICTYAGKKQRQFHPFGVLESHRMEVQSIAKQFVILIECVTCFFSKQILFIHILQVLEQINRQINIRISNNTVMLKDREHRLKQ